MTRTEASHEMFMHHKKITVIAMGCPTAGISPPKNVRQMYTRAPQHCNAYHSSYKTSQKYFLVETGIRESYKEINYPDITITL